MFGTESTTTRSEHANWHPTYVSDSIIYSCLLTIWINLLQMIFFSPLGEKMAHMKMCLYTAMLSWVNSYEKGGFTSPLQFCRQRWHCRTDRQRFWWSLVRMPCPWQHNCVSRTEERFHRIIVKCIFKNLQALLEPEGLHHDASQRFGEAQRPQWYKDNATPIQLA